MIEFIDINTGESFCLHPNSIKFIRSRNTDNNGIKDWQVTSIGFSDIELDIEGTYDEVCQAMKTAGYDVKSRMYYIKKRSLNQEPDKESKV